MLGTKSAFKLWNRRLHSSAEFTKVPLRLSAGYVAKFDIIVQQTQASDDAAAKPGHSNRAEAGRLCKSTFTPLDGRNSQVLETIWTPKGRFKRKY